VPRSEAVRAGLAAVQPALVEPNGLLELHWHDLDDSSGLPTMEQIRGIEPGPVATVTAVVVSFGADDRSAAAALALRDRSGIEARWQAPIFVEMAIDGSLTSLLDARAHAADPADRIVPIGTIGSTCRVDSVFGGREVAARALHEAYLARKGVAAE